MRFGKAARILRRREFLAVQQRGERLFAGKLVVLALHAGGTRPRIGITVPGKVANAVIRNRIKRWVREAFRAVAADLPPVDLVVIARSGARRDRPRRRPGGARGRPRPAGPRGGAVSRHEPGRAAARGRGARLPVARVSPLLPPSCRFYPSCSAYAVTALQRHGAVTWELARGAAAWRAATRSTRAASTRSRREILAKKKAGTS